MKKIKLIPLKSAVLLLLPMSVWAAVPPGVSSCVNGQDQAVGSTSGHKVTLKINNAANYVLANENHNYSVTTNGAYQTVDWNNTAHGFAGSTNSNTSGSNSKSMQWSLPSGKHTIWATSQGSHTVDITKKVRHYYCRPDARYSWLEVTEQKFYDWLDKDCKAPNSKETRDISTVTGQDTINYDLCSYDETIASNKPTIALRPDFIDTGMRVEGKVIADAYTDPLYSKAAQENRPVTYDFEKFIISEWTGNRCEVVEEFSSWQRVKSNITSDFFGFNYYGCEYRFRSRVFDGNFYSSWAYTMVEGSANSGGTGGTGGTGGGTGGGDTGGSCTGSRCTIEP